MKKAKTTGRIGWLIDFPIKRSGGHKTFIDYANALIEHGFEVDLYVRQEGSHSAAELLDIIADYLVPTTANVIPGWNVTGRYDMLIATWFKNAQIVADYPFAAHKLYFVQDYDPYLQMMGDDYILAEHSYSLGLPSFTMGRWLGHKLQSEFDAQVIPSFLGADLETYSDLGQTREHAVCILFQPEKARRLAGLAVKTMETIRRVRPDLTVYSYGSWVDPNIEGVEHLGLLELNELNALYNRCRAGIGFSPTNPSRTPFEMMAAGLPVVELYRDNNLFDMPEKGVVLADADPIDVAAAVVRLIDDEAFWFTHHQGGKEFMQTRSLSTATKEFVTAVSAQIAGKKPGAKTLKQSYTLQPFTAESDFLVKDRVMSDYRSEVEKAAVLERSGLDSFLERRRRFETLFKPLIKLAKISIRALQISVATVYLAIRDLTAGIAGFIAARVSAAWRTARTQFQTAVAFQRSWKLVSFDIFDTLLRRVCHPEVSNIKPRF